MENKSDVTDFFVACRNTDVRTAKELLKNVHPSSLLTMWEGRTCFHVAVIAGDLGLLGELAAKLPVGDSKNIIRMGDNNGDTALHLAVRKNRLDLAKQLVDLDANLCDCANQEGQIPLKLAIRLGFKEAVELFITCTQNALHYVVKLNQVKLVQLLIENEVELSKLINRPYQPSDGGDGGLTNASSSDARDKPWQSAEKNQKRTDEERTTQSIDDEPTVVIGDTPLHIAARNKSEHMVNLLLKVDGVDKLALNGEDRTPFEIAREVMEYHESFVTIRKLSCHRGRPRPFMYCAPQVSNKKLMEARRVVKKSYEDNRNAEQVVAALLATMTFTAAFSMPGGFQTENTQVEEIGSPLLIHFPSFKLFLLFNCLAFLFALFVCIKWQMIPVHSPGDKMLFMTFNSLMIYCSFGLTALALMAAMYTVLARKAKTFSWTVLGGLSTLCLIGLLAGIRELAVFAVARARFHRLCGVSCFFDDIVENVWYFAERYGLFRSGDEFSLDFIAGHNKYSGQGREDGHNSGSSSPFRTRSSVHRFSDRPC